jgi:hypothetical protein
MRDRVRYALHIGMKWAMAVVCSGFSYDMNVVSHGFVSNITKTKSRTRRGFAILSTTLRNLVRGYRRYLSWRFSL